MSAENELLHFALDWDKAIVRNDVKAISQYISDDWVIVGTEGGITTRESFLGVILNGDLTHLTMHTDEARVKIYGDTGIITARGTSAGRFRGKDFEYYEWSTSVFIRQQDQWKCVHTMLTPARK